MGNHGFRYSFPSILLKVRGTGHHIILYGEETDKIVKTQGLDSRIDRIIMDLDPKIHIHGIIHK